MDHSRRVSVLAPAKVNLMLHVLGRRADGYHEVDTVIQQVDFGDDVVVRLTRTPGVTIKVTARPRCDPGPHCNNLAYLAARAYVRAATLPWGVSLTLHKRIPVGSGLGGGSSDAAAVLRVLDHLTEGALGPLGLRVIGTELGSDVAAFLSPSPLIRARGRGEVIEPLTALPARRVTIISPPLAISTETAYQKLSRVRCGGRLGGGAETLSIGHFDSWSELDQLAHNDFAKVVIPWYPEVGQVLDSLRDSSCEIALLSGSGSSCFGLGCASRPVESEWPTALTQTLTEVPPVTLLE